MNTLQLIKARTIKNRAVQMARLQMAKAFRNPDYIDAQHTPLGQRRKQRSTPRRVFTLS